MHTLSTALSHINNGNNRLSLQGPSSGPYLHANESAVIASPTVVTQEELRRRPYLYKNVFVK